MFIRVLITFAVLSFTIQCGAQDASQTCKGRKSAAVNSLRLINTAENMYQAREGHYADLQTLVSSGTIQKAQSATQQLSERAPVRFDPSEPAVGFDSHFVLSGDSTKYSVTIRSSEPSCKSGFTTDDRGVIYYVEPMR